MPKPEKRKKKLGRPTKFGQKLADRILDLALKGATEKEIARAIGISLTTLKNWKGAHPDFLAALRESKGVAEDLVEAALFHRAVGYRHPAVKIFCDKDGCIHTQRYTEVYPPDTTAIKFYLGNRRPKKWKDQQKLDVTLKNDLADELKKARERVKKGR